MAEVFRTFYRCSNCGFQQTVETDTLRWIRKLGMNHGPLSQITRYDVDQIFWKWSHDGSVHWMIDIEIKEHGRQQSDRDKQLWRMRDGRLRGQWSNGVQHLGCHVLRVEGADPPRSKWIEWDGHRVTESMLVDILAFRRPPDLGQPGDDEIRFDEATGEYVW
jgi:hypothetical protein